MAQLDAHTHDGVQQQVCLLPVAHLTAHHSHLADAATLCVCCAALPCPALCCAVIL